MNIEIVIPSEGRAALDALVPGEAARARELADAGVIRRLWRIPGRWANWGLWSAPDADQLQAALRSLPLYPYMRIEVHPLAAHPSDPAGPEPAERG